MGSFDRDVHSDEPHRPDRPDAAADRPRPPRETEAQLAERLGLPNLTRAAAYESLYAKAQAQDAPFRERLAREEREKSAESSASLTESTGKPAPPIDHPERDPEAPRTYPPKSPASSRPGSAIRTNGRESGSWSRLLGTMGVISTSVQKDVPGRQMRWIRSLDLSRRLATPSNKLSEKILNEDGWQASNIAPKVESV